MEQSHLPVKRTLDMLGIPHTTVYRWYDRSLSLGATELADRPSCPGWAWNWIPDTVRSEIVDLAVAQPELSARELASASPTADATSLVLNNVFSLLDTLGVVDPGGSWRSEWLRW